MLNTALPLSDSGRVGSSFRRGYVTRSTEDKNGGLDNFGGTPDDSLKVTKSKRVFAEEGTPSEVRIWGEMTSVGEDWLL